MVREIFRRTRDIVVRDWNPLQSIADERALRAEALELLRIALDNPVADFRDGQWEAIRDLVIGRQRLLLVHRTGWGKTLVYFIASILLRRRGTGPTLLISPLLSLMRNQIAAAERMGVLAATINSTNREDWREVEARLLANDVDILLISPERLSSNRFRSDVLAQIAGQIGMFVVDEAHCISDWGHDFRPDYRRIVRILQLLPRNVPVLATTATANDRVVDDIEVQIGKRMRVVRGPLVRRSLRLQTIHLAYQAPRLAWLAENIPNMPGSGIVYSLTKRDADTVAAWLRSNGIVAEAYHADLDNATRERLEQALIDNEVDVLVATVALGMGFDKPDLGFVIHFQRPGSIIHYYQQIGRAGRGLDNAFAILLHSSEDDKTVDFFIRNSLPREEEISLVLASLEEARNGRTRKDLERSTNLSPNAIEGLLRFLAAESPSPINRIGNRLYATPVNYRFDHQRFERLTEQRRAEQARMAEYVTNESCLMEFLLDELNDPHASTCGRCEVCLGQPHVPRDFSQELARQAHQFLRNQPVRIQPRTNLANSSRRIPSHLLAAPGYALCRWGDSEWGDLISAGKLEHGRFDDRLVGAVEEMLNVRWRPSPRPEWVASVPSTGHAELVPDFARRLAAKLGLPYIDCVKKTRYSAPQKEMQNEYQQYRNVQGAFALSGPFPAGSPVLLVDDMVDSGWTFTEIAALLRGAGSGNVYPLALASARTRQQT